MVIKNNTDNIIELPHKGDGEILADLIKKHLEDKEKEKRHKDEINKKEK